jgi:hypothetical protein
VDFNPGEWRALLILAQMKPHTLHASEAYGDQSKARALEKVLSTASINKNAAIL